MCKRRVLTGVDNYIIKKKTIHRTHNSEAAKIENVKSQTPCRNNRNKFYYYTL